MSIIVNGVDMPIMLTVNKDGTASMQFNDVDGGFYRVNEIPTPHGRLIDADRLIAVLKSTTAISQSDYDLFNHIVGLIEHQPTVIEAEQGNGR